MPLNSGSEMLARWVEMDRQLASEEGLNVAEFCKEHGVSARTVHRDMNTIREQGFVISCYRVPGRTVIRWEYIKDNPTRTLFTINEVKDRTHS